MKTRTLKHNKNYNPCEAKIGDECYINGIFKFNISELIKYIKQNPEKFQPEEINVEDYSYFCGVNEKHINPVNINKPVILAEIAPEQYNLIDGNHRVTKAKRLNKETVMAYKIPMEEHINFIIDKKSYEKYVQYWNEKCYRITKQCNIT